MERLTTPDVNVAVINFPNTQKEMVMPNEDGSYTILINAKLSYSGQLKAYEHAMKHIQNGDFEKDCVQTIEYHAHTDDEPATIFEPADKYLERVTQLQRDKLRIQRQMRKDRERVQFIRENCDMFKRAEHQYLYGNNL